MPSCQADRKVTPCAFLPWVATDRRQTASDGREVALGVRSEDRQRRRNKKHLIEAAPFGLLEQMLRTISFQGGALAPQQNPGGSGGQRPPVKTFEKNESKKIFF